MQELEAECERIAEEEGEAKAEQVRETRNLFIEGLEVQGHALEMEWKIARENEGIADGNPPAAPSQKTGNHCVSILMGHVHYWISVS